MRVAVAMSGGVDSSAVAAILKDEGHELVGLSMQLWNQRRINIGPDGEPLPSRCCSLDDIYDARMVASRLGFPFYVINLEDNFEENVVAPFVESYLNGKTPSPCVSCNSHLKFAKLVELAAAAGSEKIATGHYAQVDFDETTQRYRLFKGLDRNKDQSYFLFELTQEQLHHALFPLGAMTKTDVREIARKHNLLVAEKGESQEICFVPDGDYARFIESYLKQNNQDIPENLAQRLYQLKAKRKVAQGDIVLTSGKVLAQHQGIHNYTIGQRRGLGIAWPEALYVIALDADANRVVVGTKDELPGHKFTASKINWVSGDAPTEAFRANTRIRYRHKESAAKIIPVAQDRVRVEFDEPQLAITPGQAVVFYDGDFVLGGGWIDSIGR